MEQSVNEHLLLDGNERVIIDLSQRGMVKAMLNGERCIGHFEYQVSRTERGHLIESGADVVISDTVYYLHSFLVDDNYRNNGIGSLMLKSFKGFLKNGAVISLDCRKSRLAFYKRNGFKIAQKLDFFLFDDCYQMYHKKH